MKRPLFHRHSSKEMQSIFRYHGSPPLGRSNIPFSTVHPISFILGQLTSKPVSSPKDSHSDYAFLRPISEFFHDCN